MALISRTRARPSAETEGVTAPTVETTEPTGQASLHIGEGGRVVIDLTDGDPTTTTDITCPNCRGHLRVEDVDRDLRTAELHCLDCHFRFAQRLTVDAGDRAPTPDAKPRSRFGRGKH